MSNSERNKETALKFQALRNDYKSSINPSEFPGTMSLIYELDSRVLLMTTDNEAFTGEPNSFDSFGSVILSKTKSPFNDVNYGTCYFRSEQISFIGHIDKEKEENEENEFLKNSELISDETQ